jgi:hypothetical protein
MAVLSPVFRPLIGVVNGTNVVFRTPHEYVSGSVRVFVNGVLYAPEHEDGWEEVGPKSVRLRVPPVVGDVLQACYLPL